jgi:enamine deaminase RidA (YjgF/YER057c/UK114 family)
LRSATRGGWTSSCSILKLTVFLTDLPAFRTVRDESVDAALPRVAGLVHPEFRVEIDVLAVVSA